MGTKLMSDADGLKLRKPNQYVETIVYNEEPDSDGSDGSEIYNTDDVHNMVLVNQERFDLLNDPTSLENTLCHKFGDLKMRTSNVSMHYDKHLLFKDPYIREQLQNLNILQVTSNEFDDHLLPASLLDYICCKRLDDNYNFYMDNIIKYVRHTIDQLKRISNGDYLTEKAKEKWRESVYATNSSDAKILATSSSIPLQIERKANINSSSLNEAIHSEVDIRTLSKILEKKIIVEIPKIIPGSYKLFSKLCSDKLVLGCKREHQSKNIDIKKMSQFDVVLQLGQSASRQIMSNLSSIMIWQTSPSVYLDKSTTTLIPILYSEAPKEEKEKQAPKLVEIKETNEEFVLTSMSLEQNISEIIDESEEKTPKLLNDVIAETADTSLSTEREEDYCDDDEYNFNNIVSESSDSSALKDFLDTEVVTNIQPKETQFKITTSEALALSIQSLNMDSLPEENCEDFKNPVKRKSSPRVRVKSPYENKSYLIEEKKRKKLLEIRERREKKKIAMGESCKIKKNRYGKGSVMPRPSSSVTKLSITNKSFYNSIYGQTAKHVDMKIRKYKSNEGKKDFIADEHIGEEQVPEMLTPDVNNKKYIDRSYYLDEAVTEMMYTEPSDHSSDVRELFSVSTSAGSNLEPNMSMPPTSITSPCDKLERFDEHNELNALNENGNQSSVASFQNTLNVRPSILLSNNELVKNGRKKSIPIECRRSIDKIYDLMKKLSNSGAYECKSPESKCTTIDSNKIDENVYQEKSMKYSDSGTSLKHLLVSSNPSSFSFGKICTTDRTTVSKNGVSKKTNGLMTVVPKVIISTKQHDPNLEIDKVKKERKKVSMNTQKVPENPLKAISQLLHEFDSVQKTRQKLTTGTKSNKKLEISFENRNTSRSGFMKTRSRLETTDVIKNDHVNEKKVIPKERKPRPIVGYDTLKLSEQPLSCEDRHIERTTKKRLADIIDEVKEAKGEAVRGPSKFTSRLNTLAQPKKSYVQAHSEEYQTKYGRTIVADRLQRLAGAQVAMQNPERQMGSAGTRGRSKRSAEAASATITRQQPPSLPPLAERAAKHRRPKSASPEKSMMPEATSYNHSHVLDAPEILKNKMVAVESYVKSHYGHALLPGGEQARSAIKARVPLVPDDLQLSPVSSPTEEESVTIGNKLHHIINSIIKPKPIPLTALAEYPENDIRNKEDRCDEELHSRDENPSSVDSECRVDIFKDRNVKTAVQNLHLHDDTDQITDEIFTKSDAIKRVDEEIFESDAELEELENALSRRISIGAFSKRLRIKQLTITPKQSEQQVFLVQSGDGGPIILQSKLSKRLKISMSQSSYEKNIKELQSTMKPQIDRNITRLPLQITTVGYAFPQYSTTRFSSKSVTKSVHDIFKAVSCTSFVNNNSDFAVNHSRKAILETDLRQNIHFQNSSSTAIDKKVIKIEQSHKVKVISESVVDDTSDALEKANVVLDEIPKGVNNSLDKIQNFNIETNIKDMNSTSSLDVLVGLLNEIQKITACHITTTKNCTDNKECKQLENTIQCERRLDYIESRELISIASLNRMNKLNSNPSIYSTYISNDESESAYDISKGNNALYYYKPITIDKEISVNFPEKVFTSNFTDVPSLFPITVTNSTNVTNSLLEILCEPSKQSILSFKDCETTNRESSNDYLNKIVEISESVIQNDVTKQHSIMYVSKNEDDYMNAVVNRKNTKYLYMRESDVTRYNSNLLKTEHVNRSNCDPLLNMKRDILVTVYSMLVLTVFAALSFPEMLYYDI